MRRLAYLAVLVAATGTTSAAADDAAPLPSNYVAGFIGTTLAYRPPHEAWSGWQHDVTPLLGYGRQLSPTVALELDLGPTFVRSAYSSFSLTPGLVWAFHTNAYVAARFVVPVDPATNLVFPGIGLCRPIGRVMPTLELNLSRTVGRGHPDLGVALTAGVLFF